MSTTLDVTVSITCRILWLFRLSRDPIHLFILAEECARAGCELLFVTEPLDNSDEGQLIQHFRGYVSKVERAKIKERSLRGKTAKLQSGKLLASRKSLYGYRNIPETGKCAIYEPEAAVVRQIYGQAAEGYGIISIKNFLFEQNILPPEGRRLEDGHARRWPTSTIQKILREPSYKGETYAWQSCARATRGATRLRPASERIRMPDDVTPPIITPELWQAVQHRLATNRGDTARNSVRQYLLRGLAYCANCGRKMYSDCAHGFRYYRCSSKTLDGKPCGVGVTRADKAEAAVWDQVKAFLADPERSIRELRRQQKNGPDPQLTEDRATTMRRLAENERKLALFVKRLFLLRG